jgi:hypothetical protein
MAILSITYPATPSGKRRIAQNGFGNWVGYVSGKRFWEFGCDVLAEDTAASWLATGDLTDAYINRWKAA